jgi:hypothetical protein
MRLTLVSLVLIAFTSVATARPRSAADDALAAKLLAHADKISTILEQNVDSPKKGLAAIDRYLKKNRKPMKKLVGKMVGVANELDDDARGDLARDLMFGESTQRFLGAVSAFRDKHGDDPVYAKKIDALVDELTTEGKPLFDALMQ